MNRVKKQSLVRLSRLNFFSRMEMAELPNILMPDEHLLAAMSGFYTAGTATLCVTSKRLLLIDKKLLRLSYEDIRFEAISEVNFSQQLLLGSVKFFISGRNLQFRSWYKRELRTLAQFVQNKMFEAREHAGALSGDFGLLPKVVEQASRPSVFPGESEFQPNLFGKQGYTRMQRWRRSSEYIKNLAIARGEKS